MLSVPIDRLQINRKNIIHKPSTPFKGDVSHAELMRTRELTNVDTNILQAYYLCKPKTSLSFGHKEKEHYSYGLTFNYDQNNKPLKGAQIKIFTFDNLKSLEIEVAKDPAAGFVKDYKSEVDPQRIKSFPLENKGNGIYEAQNLDINPGDRYRLKLGLSNGENRYISDLYSYDQKGLTEWPVAYDQKAYDRTPEGKVNRIITQNWNKGIIAGKVNNLQSLTNPQFINSQALRLIQVHLGTFTEAGNFEEAIKKLDEIKQMGFNGIEIMPHGFFQDINWGYDPSFVFASQYGGTNKFKKFCDEAHKRGLNIVVDLVNNHYSQDHPEIMSEAGPYKPEGEQHEFGPRINYTQAPGKNGSRDWRVNEALYWLATGADSVRFDLPDFTKSKHFNTQLNIEIQEHFPGTATFAESPSIESSNPLPAESLLTKLPEGSKQREEEHIKIIRKAQNDEFGTDNQGFTHRWHFDWSHAIEHTVLHPSDRDISYLKANIYHAQNHLKALFSHDEIGKQEADGNDLVVKILLSKLFSNDIGDIPWQAPYEKYQKYWRASRAMRELTRIYLTNEPWPGKEKQLAKEVGKYVGDINDHNSPTYGIPDYNKGGLGLGDLGWSGSITKEDFGKILEGACAINKAAMGFLFTQPGPKMIFQSFNKPDRRFAFFRKNSDYFYNTFNPQPDVKVGIDWETKRKGHKLNAPEILDQAKVDSLNGHYSPQALNYQKNMKRLITKLNILNTENPALADGKVIKVVDYHKDLISVHSKKGDNEIYSITHFDDKTSYDDYKIYFPPGKWEQILSTNDKEFGGEGNYSNNLVTEGKNVSIKLPKASTLVFKRIQ